MQQNPLDTKGVPFDPIIERACMVEPYFNVFSALTAKKITAAKEKTKEHLDHCSFS